MNGYFLCLFVRDGMQVPKTQQFPVPFAIRAVRVGRTAAREAAGEIAILFPASPQLAHRLFHGVISTFPAFFHNATQRSAA